MTNGIRHLSRATRTLSFLALCVGFVNLLQGQTGISYPDALPQRGVVPNGSYSFDKLEAIDKTTGLLSYRIPLTTMPLGRAGFSVPISLVYSSAQFDYSYSLIYQQGPPSTAYTKQELIPNPYGGWNVGYRYGLTIESKPNTGSCSNSSDSLLRWRSSIVMPDGSHHVLHIYGYNDDGNGFYVNNVQGVPSCADQSSLTGIIHLFTADGSYIRVDYDTTTQNWTASFNNGMTAQGHGLICNTISDKNGNKVTMTDGYDASNNIQTVLSDDLGRTVTITQPNTGGFIITQAGYGGQPLTWRLAQSPTSQGTAFSFQYSCVPAQSQLCAYSFGGGGTDVLQVPGPAPNTSLTYTFGYGQNNGELETVTLPTGATTTYTYRYENYGNAFPTTLNNPIQSKQVTWYDHADNGNAQRVEQWSYAWNNTPAISCTITAPDGGQEITYLTGQTYTLTQKMVKPSGETLEYGYRNNRPLFSQYPAGTTVGSETNPYIAVEIRSMAASGSPALSAVTTYSVNKNGNNVAQVDYDWVAYSSIGHASDGFPTWPSGTLIHSLTNTYTASTSTAGTGAESINDESNAYWNPGSPRFLSLVASSSLTGAGTGSLAQFGYDANGNMTSEKHWNSTKAPSMPANLDGTNASVTSRSFDAYGNLLSLVDPNGNTTLYTYDSSNLYPVKRVQASGSSSARTFTYGWETYFGLITAKTDVDNNVTTNYGYDQQGRQTNVTEANGLLGRQTNTIYDDLNQRVIVKRDKDSSGDGALVSVTNYDQLGRVALTQQLENANAQSATDLTAGIKVQTRYQYSGSNLYKLTSNPYRASTSTAAAAEQTMGWTVSAYDQDGRMIASTSFEGTGLPSPWGSNTNTSGAVTTSYNAQQTTVTDQAGKVRTSAADGAGRLAMVNEDPAGLNYTTTYSYDALDNLVQVNQGVQTRTFGYDSLKRLSYAIAPENGAINYHYDANGNLIWRDDNAGQQTCYSIDSLNRVTQKVYFGGSVDAGASGNCAGIPAGNLLSTPSVTYTYGSASGTYSIGRLLQVSNSNSTTNYTAHDALGRVLASNQQTAGQTYPFSYSYNLAGSLTAETYPSGRTVTTNYDMANRAWQVSGVLGSQSTNYVYGVTYAAQGGFSAHSYGNGVATKYAYNARLQQTERTDTLGSANCGGASNAQYTGPNQFLMDLAFFWGGSATQTAGNNGSLMSQLIQTCVAGTANNQYETFSYDGVDRLTQITDNGGGQSVQAMVYDQYGNMSLDLGNSSGTLPVSPLTPGPRQIDPATNRLTTVGAAYDGVGNLIAVGSPALTASYDAENRQIAAGTNAQTTYAYDGDGQRVSKVSAGVTTVYVYDASGAMAAEYSTAAVTPPCATCYLSWDHLGSTRMVTDQSGTVVARHDYLPFGEEILSGYAGRTNLWGGTDNVNQKFTGKERDQETGLDYFGARYYGSALGRFTSPDWSEEPEPVPYATLANPQSLNLYAYLMNHPLDGADPDGHDSLHPCTGKEQGAGQCSGGDVLVQGSAQQGPTIGPLLKTPGTQVGERLVGAAKGAVRGFLQFLNLLAGSPEGNEATRLIAELGPNTQDEQFGGEVFSVASLFFGFSSFEEVGAGQFVGQFKNGATVLVNISQEGDTLTVGIPLVTKVSAETFRNIEAGAIKAAKEGGAANVRIVGGMVRDGVSDLLKRKGFVEEEGNFVKTISVK